MTAFQVVTVALALLSILDISQGNSHFPEQEGKRLIKTSENGQAQWLSEEEILSLMQGRVHFIDVTGHEYPAINRHDVDTAGIPRKVRFQDTVKPLLTKVNTTRIQAFVKKFSSFQQRHYKTNSGTDSQQWLLKEVKESLKGYNGSSTVSEVGHSSWPQKSIIARINGTDPELQDQIVIVGGHQDSINMFNRMLPAPGADDNASGSVVVLETLRVLAETGFVPKRTIEFHWYAAEEGGLKGSGEIAKSYYKKKVHVVSMVNFDVSGYQAADIHDIGIYTDNTNPVLNSFLRNLTEEYLEYGWRDEKCGYGCSDHASWTKYGYPAAMPAEVKMHPSMHTPLDNYDNVGFKQVTEFAKLSVGYIVEVAEPIDTAEK